MATDPTLLIQTAGTVIAELVGVKPEQALRVSQAVTDVVAEVITPTPTNQLKAIAGLEILIGTIAAANPGNPTIQFANKVIGEFSSAKASYEAGQAVVLGSPIVDGKPGLVVLVAKGGTAAEALGV
jgi:hypothetical protein